MIHLMDGRAWSTVNKQNGKKGAFFASRTHDVFVIGLDARMSDFGGL